MIRWGGGKPREPIPPNVLVAGLGLIVCGLLLTVIVLFAILLEA